MCAEPQANTPLMVSPPMSPKHEPGASAGGWMGGWVGTCVVRGREWNVCMLYPRPCILAPLPSRPTHADDLDGLEDELGLPGLLLVQLRNLAEEARPNPRK